jgi:cyclin D1/2/4, plant
MCNQVGDARFVFEAKTIQRMELLVLTTLNWRMQAVTPFSYVDYFLNRLSGGNAALRNCLFQSAELILCAARGIQRKLLSLYHGKWYGLLCPFRVLN